ncbi:hypothetical protein OC834_007040, partial [Tilletia horrida]
MDVGYGHKELRGEILDGIDRKSSQMIVEKVLKGAPVYRHDEVDNSRSMTNVKQLDDSSVTLDLLKCSDLGEEPPSRDFFVSLSFPRALRLGDEIENDDNLGIGALPKQIFFIIE